MPEQEKRRQKAAGPYHGPELAPVIDGEWTHSIEIESMTRSASKPGPIPLVASRREPNVGWVDITPIHSRMTRPIGGYYIGMTSTRWRTIERKVAIVLRCECNYYNRINRLP